MEHTDAQKEDRETTDLLTTLLVSSLVLFDKWFFEYLGNFFILDILRPAVKKTSCLFVKKREVGGHS